MEEKPSSYTFHHGLASHRESTVSKTSSTSSTPPFEQPEFSPEARPSQSMYMAHYPGQELVPYSQQSSTVLHAGKTFHVAYIYSGTPS